MIRRACLAAALGLVATTAPAQDNAAKARLDEFAAPTSTTGIVAEQVASPSASAAVAVDQPVDRSIGSAQSMPATRTPATDQVAPAVPHAPVRQVSQPGDRQAQAAAPLSRREEGRPQGTERLDGADRCDPQARSAEAIALCKRIIELRAREFSATEAPRLSAEQELLARQSSATGGTLANLEWNERAPTNAEERAAQELGFLALAEPGQTPPPEEEQPADSGLSEALRGILVQMGVPQP